MSHRSAVGDAKEPLHVRTIRVEAAECGDDELIVTGTLVDERPPGGVQWFGTDPPRVIHHMRVGLRVRHRDLVITGVEARMEAHPYRICPDALPPLDGLVGVSIARGFTRTVNERFGRERGCAHVTALIHAMAPVVRQAAGALRERATTPAPAGDALWMIDTCQAWRAEGTLHAMLRRNDQQGLRAITAYADARPGAAAPPAAEAGDSARPPAERGAPPPDGRG